MLSMASWRDVKVIEGTTSWTEAGLKEKENGGEQLMTDRTG